MSSLVIRRGFVKLAGVEDGPSLEQQFGILTNGAIADKYPKLDRMKLAFQLLEKSDNNNDAAGAAVYLVGSTVIFIPSFLRNGKIRTGDMMFLPSTQQFLPLSDPWLAWIKDKELQPSGESVDQKFVDGNMTDTAITIQDVIDPIVKTGSAYLRGVLRTDPDLKKQAAGINVFDTVATMGKRASATVLDELSSNNTFLNAALHFYSAEDIDGFAKRAVDMNETTSDVEVVLPFTKEAKLLTASEKEILDRDGYLIRKLASDTPNVTRSRNIRREFATVSKPGKFDLLRMDGTTKTCLVMRSKDLHTCNDEYGRYETFSGDSDGIRTYGQPGDNAAYSMYHKKSSNGLVALTSESSTSPVDLAHDTMAMANGTAEDFSADMLTAYGRSCSPSSVPELGWDTCILCPDGVCYRLVGGNFYAHNGGWCSPGNQFIIVSENKAQIAPIVSKSTIVLPFKSRILGDCGMPEAHVDEPVDSEDMDAKAPADSKESDGVKNKHMFAFVTVDMLDYFLSSFVDKHYRKLRLTSDGHDVYVDGVGGDSGAQSVKEASLKLVKDYGIAPGVARTMLHEVMDGVTGGYSTELYYIDKMAAEDPEETANIPGHQVQNTGAHEEMRQMPMVTESPEQLTRAVVQAAENGIKEVFDVTAFKIMLRQNRFLEEINDDLPMFMKCLDSLCRKLFLFYWHTEDFESRYGTVKLKSLEDSLKTTIDSLSEITVFFKMRTVDGDTGIGDDGGDLMSGHGL